MRSAERASVAPSNVSQRETIQARRRNERSGECNSSSNFVQGFEHPRPMITHALLVNLMTQRAKASIQGRRKQVLR